MHDDCGKIYLTAWVSTFFTSLISGMCFFFNSFLDSFCLRDPQRGAGTPEDKFLGVDLGWVVHATKVDILPFDTNSLENPLLHRKIIWDGRNLCLENVYFVGRFVIIPKNVVEIFVSLCHIRWKSCNIHMLTILSQIEKNCVNFNE